MEEFSEGLATAWHDAVRGVKRGYKTALKTIDRQIRTSAAGGTTRGDVRRLFQLRYGAEVRNDEGEKVAAAEASDAESDNEPPLTDEQVHERVDKVFFDRSYNGAAVEITRMEVAYADSPEDIKGEREKAEARLLELRQKCDVVSTTLKKRVLTHHKAFMRGVDDMRLVNESLFSTSSDCKRARMTVRKSRSARVAQIELLAQHRKRRHVLETQALLSAMKQMLWRRDQLLALVASGKLVEASKLLKENADLEIEAPLSRLDAMKSVLQEWHAYRDNPTQLAKCVETVLAECLTVNFIASTYRNAIESSATLTSPQQTTNLIVSLLWRSAVHILTRSLTELSHVKDDTASIADISEGIHPDHLLLGYCQMSMRLTDFFNLYGTITRLHAEEAAIASSPCASLHALALRQVQDVGRKVYRDLTEKLCLALSHSRLMAVDIDRVLHAFVIGSLLVEASEVLTTNQEDIAEARRQLIGVLVTYMRTGFQRAKAREMLQFMMDDSWTLHDVSAASLHVVRSLSGDGYQRRIKEVRAYLTDTTSITTRENPFLSPSMVAPQDTSQLVQTETFGEYWAALHKPKAATVLQPQPQTPALTDEARDVIVAGTSPTKLASTSSTEPPPSAHVSVAEKVSMPPTALTSSAVSACNTFVEYAARVCVRFPPLAADILGWTEELVELYMYTVADNFVSVSRSVPIENQGDFSRSTQAKLAELRATGERAVGASNGTFLPCKDSPFGELTSISSVPDLGSSSGNSVQQPFPPRVWQHFRLEFASEAHQYALGRRAVACEASITVLLLHEAVVRSFTSLLPTATVQLHLTRCQELYHTATEVLHVCMHRLCLAIFPMESVCTDIAKLRTKNEVCVSPYVSQLVRAMTALSSRRQPMPTAVLEKLFWQRFIFAVQSVLVREYSKLAKRKLTDLAVMQIQVDVQNFQQQAATAFGREHILLPEYVLGLVKTGFWMDDGGQRLGWLRKQHHLYAAADLVNWMGGGDKPFRLQVEDTLRELRHQDAIPVTPFTQQS